MALSVPGGRCSAQECRSLSHTTKASNVCLCSKRGGNPQLLTKVCACKNTHICISSLPMQCYLILCAQSEMGRADLKTYNGHLKAYPYRGLAHIHGNADTRSTSALYVHPIIRVLYFTAKHSAREGDGVHFMLLSLKSNIRNTRCSVYREQH